MKINWPGGKKNIIGTKVFALRTAHGMTQKALAAKMQLQGVDATDLTILRIESGSRFVPDYEVQALARIFGVSTDELLEAKPRLMGRR